MIFAIPAAAFDQVWRVDEGRRDIGVRYPVPVYPVPPVTTGAGPLSSQLHVEADVVLLQTISHGRTRGFRCAPGPTHSRGGAVPARASGNASGELTARRMNESCGFVETTEGMRLARALRFVRQDPLPNKSFRPRCPGRSTETVP